MFDPWNSTFEEANSLQQSIGGIGPTDPLFQWVAAEEIKAHQKAIQEGDGLAVLSCIRKLVTNGLVAPIWLAYAFNKRFDAVLNCNAKSWDDPMSFGAPYPKGAHINALKKQKFLKFAVWNEANNIRSREPETPIDAEFFERIGKTVRPPVGKTEAERLYYLAKRLMGR